MDARRRYRAPDADAFAALMQRRSLAGFLCEPMPPLQVHDLYLDTEEAALLAQGLVLRLREHGGLVSASLRPAEAEAGPGGDAAHARFREALPEGPGPVSLPAGPLREAVEARATGRPLFPLLRFRQYRTPRALYDGDRLSGVLSLDVVSDESSPAERAAVTNEVEVELVRGGRPEDLARLDEDLRALGFEPDPFAKFEGGVLRRSRGETAPLLLLPRERADLEARRRSDSAVERRRAEVILLAAEGRDTRAISREVSLSPSRVRHWRHAFRHERMRVFDADAPEPALDEAEEPAPRTFRVSEVLSVEEEFSPTPGPLTDPLLVSDTPPEDVPDAESQGGAEGAPGIEPEPTEEAYAEGEGRAEAEAEEDPSEAPSPFDVTVEEMLGQVLQAVEDRVRAADEADAASSENLPSEPPVLTVAEAEDSPPEAPPPPDRGFVGDAWFDVDTAPPSDPDANAVEIPPPPPRPDALPPHLPVGEAAARSLRVLAEALRAIAPLGPGAPPESVQAAEALCARLHGTLSLFSDVLPERDAARLRRDLSALEGMLTEASARDRAAAAVGGGEDEAERLVFALAQTVWAVERRRALGGDDPLAPLADRTEALAAAAGGGEAPGPERLAHRLPVALWARYGALRVLGDPERETAPDPGALRVPLAAFAAALAAADAPSAADVLAMVERVRAALDDRLSAQEVGEGLTDFLEEWVRPGGAADPAPLEARRARAAEETAQAEARFRPLWEALMSERFREALGRVSAAL